MNLAYLIQISGPILLVLTGLGIFASLVMWYANVNNDRKNLKADNETFKGLMVDIEVGWTSLKAKWTA